MSTIIPVYNRPGMLLNAATSVLEQRYRPIEIIIVDDGSIDDTPEVIEKLVAEWPGIVRTVRRPNGGPGAARQSGLDAAMGEFIQFLDSDDLLLPEKFTLQVAALRSDPDADIAYGKTRFYRLGETPTQQPIKRTGERIRDMFPSFLQSRWWSMSTPLFRRSIIERAGPWTDLRNEEDWEFECRIASFGTLLAYCDTFVSDTIDHPHGRLSEDGATDPGKLRDRAKAHAFIFGHACRASVALEAPEMRHFARELFLLARQCAAVGLEEDASALFELAIEASTPERRRGADFTLCRLIVKILGWKRTGLLAAGLDRVRGRLSLR